MCPAARVSDCGSKAYSDRCTYWVSQCTPARPRRVREREAVPLILTGHGLSIRVDKGCLLIRDGNTHYPAAQRQWRFFNGTLDIPPSIVVLDGSGEITLDAINWLSTQRVPLICLRWNGAFSSIVTSGGQAASPEKLHWQKRTRESPKARVAFGIEIIRQKAKSSLVTLDQYFSASPLYERVCESITTREKLLVRKPPKTIGHLLGAEGAIASDYFRVWPGMPLKWKARGRNPIPDSWQTYKTRSSLRNSIRSLSGDSAYNRSATHPVSAMMNYAYGVLITQTQIRLIADGYDPTIGVMHQRQRPYSNTPAFALDHMEPMRPVVDRAILELIRTTTFTGADFSIQRDGACRLNPELARRVAQLAYNHISGTQESKRQRNERAN